MNDILMESLSPTQQRGESKLSGGIIYETIKNAENEDVNLRIEYDLEEGSTVSNHNYDTYGNDSIPAEHLQEIVEIIIERTEGKTLIFN